MLLMLLIGWVVLLPAVVVAGLYVWSSVLGRRRAAAPAYGDLLSGGQPEDVTAELHAWASPAPPQSDDASTAACATDQPQGSASEARPVGAGY